MRRFHGGIAATMLLAASLAVSLSGIALAQSRILPEPKSGEPVPAAITITAVPIERFRDTPYGGTVDRLIWRGGLELRSESLDFGGLSGITFAGDADTMITVSDRGQFISARLTYDSAGAPIAISGGQIVPIANSKGNALPPNYSRDAEAVETIFRDGNPAAVRVGFENLTRVADFDLTNGRPGGAAREVTIPDWLAELRSNESLEAVCIASPASPIAGSTLLITENVEDGENSSRAFLLGVRDRGPLSYHRTAGLNPTACGFAPNGDLYVLERGLGLLTFRMQITRIPAAEVVPGNRLQGEAVLTASGGEIDNMEGLAIHQGPDGETRLSVISDDNFNDWERTLILQFALPAQD
ncbi:esterase-like activity of phytase family protein [Cucumibacter marinus]|uniref:esterase-like activity of phytase family protein n=1 Tax=Cucumibacter marinus TaxID=1121252 RepID=UPI00048DF54B|nr:esterase-like activity of phytase family protein [Cucumibacter marinus]